MHCKYYCTVINIKKMDAVADFTCNTTEIRWGSNLLPFTVGHEIIVFLTAHNSVNSSIPSS